MMRYDTSGLTVDDCVTKITEMHNVHDAFHRVGLTTISRRRRLQNMSGVTAKPFLFDLIFDSCLPQHEITQMIYRQ